VASGRSKRVDSRSQNSLSFGARIADQVDLLKNIAEQSGRSIRTLNLFDPLVCTSPSDPECPWKTLPLPGDLFRHQLSIECKGRKVRLRANSDFMVGQVSGSFAVDAFSINRRDCGVSGVRLRISGFPKLPVFADRSSGQLAALLSSVALREAVDALQLKERESLHLYTDGIVLYLQRSSVPEIMSAVEVTCSLAEQLPAVNEARDIELPSKFKVLIPFIRKWGVTDDEERSELLEKASRATLERLVKSVTPHLSSIDEYLDSFGTEALSEAAIALGALAECTLEAQLRLGHPDPKK
jgi:hypothetical protein